VALGGDVHGGRPSPLRRFPPCRAASTRTTRAAPRVDRPHDRLAFGAYLGNVLYDTAKAATARMAFGLAEELRPHRVAAVALAPGHLGVTETPQYLGRAVAALASDPEVMAQSGQLLTVGELARKYGFTDIDGTQPEPFTISKRKPGSPA
jgi:NAD(P)-dependent dehydrogenase (short-subunit alcohol dehydrogenase family)